MLRHHRCCPPRRLIADTPLLQPPDSPITAAELPMKPLHVPPSAYRCTLPNRRRPLLQPCRFARRYSQSPLLIPPPGSCVPHRIGLATTLLLTTPLLSPSPLLTSVACEVRVKGGGLGGGSASWLKERGGRGGRQEVETWCEGDSLTLRGTRGDVLPKDR